MKMIALTSPGHAATEEEIALLASTSVRVANTNRIVVVGVSVWSSKTILDFKMPGEV